MSIEASELIDKIGNRFSKRIADYEKEIAFLQIQSEQKDKKIKALEQQISRMKEKDKDKSGKSSNNN